MDIAHEITTAIPVKGLCRFETFHHFHTDCSSYRAFDALPSLTSIGDMMFEKTGWNSDKEICYYRETRVCAGF